MELEPHVLVRGTEPWPQWADAHAACDDDGKVSVRIAREYYETRDACRVLDTPNRTGTTSAAHAAAAISAHMLALHPEAATARRCGEPDLYADLLEIVDAEEQSC